MKNPRSFLLRCVALLLILLLVPCSVPAEEKITLVVSSWLPQEDLDAFMKQYPHIRVEVRENAASLQDALLSGADFDVGVTAAASGWAEILKKGYAAPLENEALSQKGKRLLPALQNIVYQGETLLAFPQNMSLVTWTLDETAWQEAGFRPEEVPGTLAEFLVCYEKWQNELASENMDRYFFEGGSLKYLVQVMVRQYIAAHETENAPVSFDDPAFREALSLLDAARPLFQKDAERAQALMNGDIVAMPLIYNYNMSYAYTGLDSHTARPLPLPALNETTPAFTEGEAYLYFVNARSAHPREAALLINFLADAMHPQQQYEIYADLNTPLENERFPELKARFTAEQEEKQALLKTCRPEEKQALEDRLAWLENWMLREDEIRWIITRRDIDLHFSLVENLRVPMESLYLAADSSCYQVLTGLIARYAAGELTADLFLAEMNRTCALAFLEQ